MATRESLVNRQPARSWHACTECKRRKVRCSGAPQCANCVRDSKECVYESPRQRTTTLFRRLQEAEHRLQLMKRAWARHLPNLDLTDVIRNLDEDNDLPESSNHSGEVSDSPRSSRIPEHDDHTVESLPTEHSNAEHFEFDESQDFDNSTDGMGSLVVEPSKSGYTGPQSGIAAFKFLQSLPLCVLSSQANPISDDVDTANLEMPSTTDAKQHLDSYFSIYHHAYPLLHEGIFRARVAGVLPKPKDGSWPILYNTVLALGAFVGAQENTTLDLPFYRLARQHLTMDILEKGSLAYVQGLTLLANYLQKRNKPNSGFVLIGVAFSMALAIGLHREFGLPSTNPYTMELRRRTWWTLFVFVSGAQLTLGRPPVSLVGVNVSPPKNLDDTDVSVDMEALPAAREAPTSVSCLIAQIKLAKIANIVQTELLHAASDSKEAVRLDRLICCWRQELPPFFEHDVSHVAPWFDVPRRILVWRSFHLRIVLSRPILLKAISARAHLDPNDPSINACLGAANECVESICGYVEVAVSPTRGLTWYATYWLITASFVQATCYVYDQTHDLAQGWRSYLSRAVDCLSILGVSCSMAVRARDILQSLLDHGESFAAMSTFKSGPTSGTQNMADSLWQYGFSGQTDALLDPNSSDYTSSSSQVGPWFFQEASDAEWLDAAGGMMLRSWYNEADFNPTDT
ncbi:hypothetical protein K461DRAFT_230512 [Myriangium duriaei CBS 260.36]|uniref:Zn(2)-C6 fungal-type domain-containing protein n=1 Tax=Myriangium duriaei CBS 260.36 TaxID=1168546 RepID=A0A9P4IXM8_9PEZI|nr:hypothetical protein K461DRAFT_230512 [Myriangium duriaei CBS 260.36]